MKIWKNNKNCRWIQPPKPLMTDDLYNQDFPINLDGRKPYADKFEYLLSNTEPVFDAADIVRCGKDLFVQNGYTTNSAGVEWISREFSRDFRVHEVLLDNNTFPCHLDAEIAILRPGLMMTCPERPLQPDLLNMIQNEENEWEVFDAPMPVNCIMPEGC